MFKRDSVTGIVCVDFKEHPVVDFEDQKTNLSNLSDVSSEWFPTFSADFMKDGKFDHQQYCLCLIAKAIDLTSIEFVSFLDYQCNQLKNPRRWLNSFLSLIQVNSEHHLFEMYQKEIDLSITFICNKRNSLSGLVKERKRGSIFEPTVAYKRNVKHDIKKIRKELKSKSDFDNKILLLEQRRKEYLIEAKNNQNSTFIYAVDTILENLKWARNNVVEVDMFLEDIRKIKKELKSETSLAGKESLIKRLQTECTDKMKNKQDTSYTIVIDMLLNILKPAKDIEEKSKKKKMINHEGTVTALAKEFYQMMIADQAEENNPVHEKSIGDCTTYLCSTYLWKGKPLKENSVRKLLTTAQKDHIESQSKK